MRSASISARALAAVLALAGCSRAKPPEKPPETRDAGRLGRVELYRPSAETEEAPHELVYLFSGTRGQSSELRGAARALADDGAVVVAVDLPSYLRGLAASDDECHYVIAELEEFAHQLEREFGFARYRSPVLAGVGAGGTLAYAALAQSPAATVGGAVAVDPDPALATRVPLCEGAKYSPALGGGFAYAPGAELPARFQQVSNAGAAAAAALVAALDPLLVGEGASGDVAGALPDLPLVEISAEAPERLFAVIWSGDGGWRDLDKTIGEILAQRGVPVVGVDSLRYFWQKREPDQVAADLARILQAARAAWNTPDALLIGYSFGADVLPFAVNRLPASERQHIALLSLLGLEPRAPFEVEVTGWLGQTDENALLVLPELQRLDLSRLQCVYGEEEETTLCTAPELAGAEIVRLEGGHHFDGDYEKLADAILDSARRRLKKKRAISRRSRTRRPRSAPRRP